MTTPLYTAERCKVAYQLNWSLSLFSSEILPPESTWLAELKDAVENDGVRLLEHHARSESVHQFLLSTQPRVTPSQIVRSVKGRLQHTVREQHPKAFRRNYHIRSVGSVSRETLESYVRSQCERHRMADDRVQRIFTDYQIHDADADLSKVRLSSHGQFIYNLHLVYVHAERWNEVREDRLRTLRDIIVRSSRRKGHLLSDAGLLSDHLHIAVGCGVDESPLEVALSYLNNAAYAHGMVRMYQDGFYVGTFGDYDLGAVRNVIGGGS